MPQISILILGSQLGMKLKWNAWVFCAYWKILGSVMEVLGHVQLKVGRVGPRCPREGPGSERKDAVAPLASVSSNPARVHTINARWPQATPFALRS